MTLKHYRLIFIAVGLIGIMLVASPAIAENLYLPGSSKYSELYLLGPNKTASGYPYSIASGQNYTIYIDVTNHLGSLAYYVLYAKLRNQTDALPDLIAQTPSILSSLYEYRFTVPEGSTWQNQVDFSFSGLTISQNQAFIKTLTLNSLPYNVDKTASWDSNSSMFTYELYFELYVYNSQSNSFSYSNLFVGLRLNATTTGTTA